MLAQLESKIVDLQSQIQATQAQITDYQTNYAYREKQYYDEAIGGGGFQQAIRWVITPYYAQKLAQAQAQLTTLQNELKTTQEQYQQEKENRKNRTTMLYQAFLLPIPSTKIQSTQKVLKSIESLQDFLKQDFLTRQYF